uniref:Uncharacterized protein n=1 Tax=Setaria italica TaxID=4555 RepID=K3YAH2_SETIT
MPPRLVAAWRSPSTWTLPWPAATAPHPATHPTGAAAPHPAAAVARTGRGPAGKGGLLARTGKDNSRAGIAIWGEIGTRKYTRWKLPDQTAHKTHTRRRGKPGVVRSRERRKGPQDRQQRKRAGCLAQIVRPPWRISSRIRRCHRYPVYFLLIDHCCFRTM